MDSDEKELPCGLPLHPAEADHLSAALSTDALPRLRPGQRRASVLCLVAVVQEQRAVLLMERARHLSRHAGQVSFPGGASDPGEHRLWSTACREAKEEADVAADRVRCLGRLPSLSIQISGFRVTPWVATPVEPVRPRALGPETARLLWVTRTRLLAVRSWERLGAGPDWYPVFPLAAEGLRVWGATALMVEALLQHWSEQGG